MSHGQGSRARTHMHTLPRARRAPRPPGPPTIAVSLAFASFKACCSTSHFFIWFRKLLHARGQGDGGAVRQRTSHCVRGYMAARSLQLCMQVRRPLPAPGAATRAAGAARVLTAGAMALRGKGGQGEGKGQRRVHAVARMGVVVHDTAAFVTCRALTLILRTSKQRSKRNGGGRRAEAGRGSVLRHMHTHTRRHMHAHARLRTRKLSARPRRARGARGTGRRGQCVLRACACALAAGAPAAQARTGCCSGSGTTHVSTRCPRPPCRGPADGLWHPRGLPPPRRARAAAKPWWWQPAAACGAGAAAAQLCKVNGSVQKGGGSAQCGGAHDSAPGARSSLHSAAPRRDGAERGVVHSAAWPVCTWPRRRKGRAACSSHWLPAGPSWASHLLSYAAAGLM